MYICMQSSVIEKGTSVGVRVGSSVGVFVGDIVGTFDGVSVGVGDPTTGGVKIGVAVGSAVGASVGTLVGTSDGVIDGGGVAGTGVSFSARGEPVKHSATHTRRRGNAGSGWNLPALTSSIRWCEAAMGWGPKNETLTCRWYGGFMYLSS